MKRARTKMENKIGLAVMGYARPEYLQMCMTSMLENSWGGAHERLVVLDFRDELTKQKNEKVLEESGFNLYQHKELISLNTNVGIGKAKNIAIKNLLSKGCEHIFLIEDDICLLRSDTCTHYINEAKKYKVEHLNFAHHGPANKGRHAIIEWNGVDMIVYPHCIGAFSYYTKNCIDKVGLIDENFYNSWEHVELTMRIINAGMHPPFWFFVDAANSQDYLKELPNSIENSSIRPRKDWQSNINRGREYWTRKHGKFLPAFPDEWAKKSKPI